MSKKRPANDPSWSGGNTTYKDKMVQMTQQERLIEEKKKQIMEKIQSQPPQPAVPQSSTYVSKILKTVFFVSVFLKVALFPT